MQDIESLRVRLAREEKELASARVEIDAAHQRIEGLRTRSTSLEKRIKLLREYVELVESGGDAPGLAEDLDSVGGTDGATAASAAVEPLLPNVSAGPAGGAAAPKMNEDPVSFEEGFEERILADEILPKADSFEEALILLMGFHRKRIRPQEILKAFRRLDYAPDVSATKATIIAQLEQQPAFFAHAGKDGFVLTTQGREEADRLLSELAPSV